MTTRGLRILLLLSLSLLFVPAQESRAEPPYPLYLPGIFALHPMENTIYLPGIYRYEADPGPLQMCEVMDQNPPDDTVLPANAAFEMHWTLKNTSTSPWLPEAASVRFLSGDRLHTGSDIHDLPYRVAPGEMIDIVIPMRAPLTPGRYTTNWAIKEGTASLCRFFVIIQVNTGL